MEYTDLTEIQKDIIQRAYTCYQSMPGFPKHIDLLNVGVTLDVLEMPALRLNYNDLLDKGLIYQMPSVTMLMRYWLSETGAELAKANHNDLEQRNFGVCRESCGLKG